jgi:hypothetical protein
VDTVDHVPPRCLFFDPKPSNLITVPCCQVCNVIFGKDDELLKTVFGLGIDPQSSSDHKAIAQSVVRGLVRKEAPAFRAAALRNPQAVMAQTTSGVYLPTWKIDVDADRLKNFGIRVVRGLYYTERGQRLPDEAICVAAIQDLPHDPERPLDLSLLNDLLALPPKVIHDDVFAYRFFIDPDEPTRSVWMLAFYQRYFIGCITGPRDADEGV